MRRIILTITAILVAALIPAGLAAASQEHPGAAAPTAGQLLAKTSKCTQISSGKYKTDDEGSANVPICDTKDAVFWKADMDIDCDGQRTDECNEDTDCCFQPDTAFHQTDGKPLISSKLPYIVVPQASSIWKYASSGLGGAGSCAVIYDNKLVYTVIGDTGPTEIIGEASYSTAKALGIDPNPSTGGTDSGVTYICFKNSKVSPIEDHDKATSTGEGLASAFVSND